MQAPPPTLSSLSALHRRSLIVHADGGWDETTWVRWLQGPSLFCDLRIPEGRPNFSDVRALDDLSARQAAWLATQQGFAGVLERDGEFFVWRRLLDFQPPSPVADSGTLHVQGDVLVEHGRYVPYVEHWVREPGASTPCGALTLAGDPQGDPAETGWRGGISGEIDGFLVRAGPWFMFARARAMSLTEPSRSIHLAATPADSKSAAASLAKPALLALVKAAPALSAARALIDCEISFGAVQPEAWIIQRSSLPWREGANLAPCFDAGAAQTRDVASDGSPVTRRWTIVEREGDEGAF